MNSIGFNKYILITILCTFLMIDGIDNWIECGLMFVMTLFLFNEPITLLPILWVSSWYSRIVVLPFIGAYFYILFLLILSLLNNTQWGFWVKATSLNRLLVCFGLWCVFTIFISISRDFEIASKVAVYVISLAYLSRISINEVEYLDSALLSISIFTSVFVFLRLVISPIPFEIEHEMSWGVWSSSSITFLTELNPNSGAQIIELLTVIIFCSIAKRKSLYYIIPLLANFYSLFLLGSRTSFYTLSIVLIVYFLFFSDLSFRQKIAFLISALFIGGILIIYTHNTIINSRIITESIVSDAGSGRLETWVDLFNNVIPNHLLTGIGVGRENYNSLGYMFDADNLYVDLLCETGLIGTVIFLIIIYQWFHKVYYSVKNETVPSYLLLFLISFLIIGVGESVFDQPLFWTTFLISMIIVNGNSSYSELQNHD